MRTACMHIQWLNCSLKSINPFWAICVYLIFQIILLQHWCGIGNWMLENIYLVNIVWILKNDMMGNVNCSFKCKFRFSCFKDFHLNIDTEDRFCTDIVAADKRKQTAKQSLTKHSCELTQKRFVQWYTGKLLNINDLCMGHFGDKDEVKIIPNK